MPGNPFKPAAPRPTLRPKGSGPRKPSARSAAPVRAPASPVGNRSKKVPAPRTASAKVTTKVRHGRSLPKVRQGATLQRPGRHG